MLKIKFSAGVAIVNFADNITLEVYGESIEEVELVAAPSISLDWMRSR